MESSNIELNRKKGYALVTINPQLYPLDVIYSAAYTFLDKAYVIIEGDPEKEIIIELKPKGKANLEVLGREFNNELLSYAFYKIQMEKNKEIRSAIVQAALLANTPEKIQEEIEKDDYDYLDDPDGIAIPWEEKYGKEENGNKSRSKEKRSNSNIKPQNL